VSSQGERTRTIADGAQFDHLAADGQRVGMNEPFVIEGVNGDEELRYPGDPMGSAGNVINCFDGNVPVAFDSCKKSIRSVYNGDLVTIKTAGGYKLTGTPNHPILTDAGFVPLGMIDHSSNLICCPMDRNISDGLDVENIPTTFEKLHNSLSVVGVGVGVAGVAVNLYGRTPDGEVDIVRTERVLRNGVEPPSLKSRMKLRLKVPNLGERFSFCQGLLNRTGLVELFGRATNGFVRCRDLCLSFISAHSGPLEGFRFALVANVSSVGQQYSSDGSAAASETFGYGLFANTGLVKIDNHTFINGGPVASSFDSSRLNKIVDVSGANPKLGSDLMPGLSRHVHVDNVVSIETKRVFEHNVYTIETNEGFYNAGGIISQNCRCAVIYELE